MFLPALFASLAVLQQTPLPAPQPTALVEARGQIEAPPAPAPATPPPSEPAQVCRTEPITGSRFGRRVCRGAVQTAADRRESQEMLRRMQGSRMPDGQ